MEGELKKEDFVYSYKDSTCTVEDIAYMLSGKDISADVLHFNCLLVVEFLISFIIFCIE